MSMIGKQVRCIKKDYNITVGDIYTVENEGVCCGKPTYILVESLNGEEYYASYFSLVSSASPLDQAEAKAEKRKCSPSMDELSFFKNTALGRCPCNIPREACEYHR
jgi:hypothetical protein